jgi:hypothetical protein
MLFLWPHTLSGPVALGGKNKQYVSTSIQGCHRVRLHGSKGMPGIANNFTHQRHRIADWKSAAQARTDKQIAHFDISGSGNVVYFKRTENTRTLGNGSHAIAVYLHWNGVGGVSNQQNPRTQLAHTYNLAQKTLFINKRLANIHPIDSTLIEDHLVSHRIWRYSDEFGHQHVISQ